MERARGDPSTPLCYAQRALPLTQSYADSKKGAMLAPLYSLRLNRRKHIWRTIAQIVKSLLSEQAKMCTHFHLVRGDPLKPLKNLISKFRLHIYGMLRRSFRNLIALSIFKIWFDGVSDA